MNANDVKKALYKEKPIAKRIFLNAKRAVYATKLENGMQINFKIPADECETFGLDIEAQLLIRWMVL